MTSNSKIPEILPEETRPLILTFRMDAQAQLRFNALRDRHFPRDRNFLKAHITAFHNLPQARFSKIEADLNAVAAKTMEITADIGGIKFLGFGSAFALKSAELSGLRQKLLSKWQDMATRQDQVFSPHITIQNKVPPAAAKALYESLVAVFEPGQVKIEGFDLWRYDHGPWHFIKHYAFSRP